MKIKPFSPILPITVIIILGFFLFLYLNHTTYLESRKQHTNELSSRILNFISRTQSNNEQLIHLLKNKWNIIDNVSTRNMDLLIDDIQPYHDTLNYDLVNIYSTSGELLVRADKPEVFGIRDMFSNHIVKIVNSK